MAGFMPDSNCIVAIISREHEHHPRAAAELNRRLSRGEDLLLAAHSLAEPRKGSLEGRFTTPSPNALGRHRPTRFLPSTSDIFIVSPRPPSRSSSPPFTPRSNIS